MDSAPDSLGEVFVKLIRPINKKDLKEGDTRRAFPWINPRWWAMPPALSLYHERTRGLFKTAKPRRRRPVKTSEKKK